MKILKYIFPLILLALVLNGCIEINSNKDNFDSNSSTPININTTKSISYEMNKSVKENDIYKIGLSLKTNDFIYGFSGKLNTNECNEIILDQNLSSLISSRNIDENGHFSFSVVSVTPFKPLSGAPVIIFECKTDEIEIKSFNTLFDSFEEISI